jgi:hypothetical protein
MSFEADELIDRARTETGLEDFGDASFREGLEVLAGALSRDSLTEIGHIAWLGQIGGYLTERLRIEDWYRRHPEIDAEEIRAPIVVTGLPRTGTTVLSNLLARIPRRARCAPGNRRLRPRRPRQRRSTRTRALRSRMLASPA